MSTPASFARSLLVLLALSGCLEPEEAPAPPADTASVADTADTGGAEEEPGRPVCGDTPPEAEATLSFQTILFGSEQPGQVRVAVLLSTLDVVVHDEDGDLVPPWLLEVWWPDETGGIDLSRAPSWQEVAPEPLAEAEPCLTFEARSGWSMVVFPGTAQGPLVSGQPYQFAVVATDGSGTPSAPVFVEGVVPEL